MDQWLSGLFAWMGSGVGEDVRNWATSIGGLFALGFASATYVRNVNLKRVEQARLVYAAVIESRTYAAGSSVSFSPDAVPVFKDGAALGVVKRRDEWVFNLNVAHGWFRVAVHNGSKELISQPHVLAKISTLGRVIETGARVSAVKPEDDAFLEFLVPNNLHPGEGHAWVTVTFRDASGRWWRRADAEPVARTRAPRNPWRLRWEFLPILRSRKDG